MAVSRRGWILFAAMCVIWGLPYLLIRVAVRDLDPAFVVFARTAIATIILLPLALSRGVLKGLRGHWPWLLAYTVIEVAVPWLALTRAEQRLTSSLAGLLVAATPLFGVAVTRIGGLEGAVGARRMTGLLVGLTGVACLVGLQIGHLDIAATLEVLGVALCYSIGPIIASRRLAGVPSLGVVTVSLGLTALAYAPFALTRPPHHVSGEVVWSVLALATVCTALAFIVFFALIAEVGPSRAVVITYVNPAVALALGVTLLGEHVTRGMAVGFPLVLLGSVLATVQRRAPAAPLRPVDRAHQGVQ
ncbi:MAG TPA: DMT family transporter [Mycobacteriales bacterium]|jgi:drug/metabolite transporter (DMT)-like permease|nr:DMT family transporter [Mycobacteriales bacterium]